MAHLYTRSLLNGLWVGRQHQEVGDGKSTRETGREEVERGERDGRGDVQKRHEAEFKPRPCLCRLFHKGKTTRMNQREGGEGGRTITLALWQFGQTLGGPGSANPGVEGGGEVLLLGSRLAGSRI